MNKIKKIMPKALSALLSLIILCSSIAVASYSAGAESTGAAAQKTEQKAEQKTDEKSTQEKAKSGLSKTETVYCLESFVAVYCYFSTFFIILTNFRGFLLCKEYFGRRVCQIHLQGINVAAF